MVLPERHREINFSDEISLLKQKLHKHAYMVIIALGCWNIRTERNGNIFKKGETINLEIGKES
jgi:hypothetical protein